MTSEDRGLFREWLADGSLDLHIDQFTQLLDLFEYDDPYFDRGEYVAEVMSSVTRTKYDRHGLRLVFSKEGDTTND
jgi:hypothetical protein